jgi:UDP-N-acetylmuramoylalanine--D-glutamate ligase
MSPEKKLKNYYERLDHSLLNRERARSSEDDHHMEFVDEVNGIAYINDARSTRLKATRNSLEAIETSVVLIIGGDDKESDYSLIAQQVKQKVVAIIYLGDHSDNIMRHYSSASMMFVHASALKEAVLAASYFAQSGDVVLFSSGCATCLDGQNYKTRGNQFKEVVRNLGK